MKKVLIGTPAYNGQVCETYMRSVLEVIKAGFAHGYQIQVKTMVDSLVTRARNNIVAEFLNGDFDYLFWIDADIGFNPDQFFRVLAIDREVATAVYPLKNLFLPNSPVPLSGSELEVSMLRYVMNLKEPTAKVPEDGFVEVLDAATGFMCIKREVFDILKLTNPELKYQSDMIGAPEGDNHWLFFDCRVEGQRYLSEDYAFCRLVQNAGIPIWVDFASQLTHTGPHHYRGNLMETARVNSGS